MNNDEGWEKVGGGEQVQTEEWKYKEAQTQEERTLVGKYFQKRTNLGENNSTLYVIEKEDGTYAGIWESAILRDKFSATNIGDQVKIEYLGLTKSKNGGRTYHNFDFYKRSGQGGTVDQAADDTEAIFDDLP